MLILFTTNIQLTYRSRKKLSSEMRILLVGSEGAPGGGCFVLFVPLLPYCRVLCKYYLFVHARRGLPRGSKMH